MCKHSPSKSLRFQGSACCSSSCCCHRCLGWTATFSLPGQGSLWCSQSNVPRGPTQQRTHVTCLPWHSSNVSKDVSHSIMEQGLSGHSSTCVFMLNFCLPLTCYYSNSMSNYPKLRTIQTYKPSNLVLHWLAERGVYFLFLPPPPSDCLPSLSWCLLQSSYPTMKSVPHPPSILITSTDFRKGKFSILVIVLYLPCQGGTPSYLWRPFAVEDICTFTYSEQQLVGILREEVLWLAQLFSSYALYKGQFIK